jgi:hypothetical protein
MNGLSGLVLQLAADWFRYRLPHVRPEHRFLEYGERVLTRIKRVAILAVAILKMEVESELEEVYNDYHVIIRILYIW